jgi:hypothetical protein
MSHARRSLALLAFLATSAGYPRSGWGQKMQLELRPRVGDTLRMRLDQVTEMSGTRKGVTSKPVVTTLRMFSRAIVESSGPTAAVILAVTDSVDVSTGDERTRALAQQTMRQLEGRQMRLRLTPDGTVSVADQTTSVPREVNELVSVMPASFPRDPVAVGETWVREMPIPQGTRFSVPAGAFVRASFRLDSVVRSGEVAYVSMRGTLEQMPAMASDLAPTGTVTGSMVIDRRRGWLSESRFLVQMRTMVTSRGGAAASAAPTQVQMKITQHMRVFERTAKPSRIPR